MTSCFTHRLRRWEAALLLALLPILVLYLFLQRYIVEGVTSGAVK